MERGIGLLPNSPHNNFGLLKLFVVYGILEFAKYK